MAARLPKWGQSYLRIDPTCISRLDMSRQATCLTCLVAREGSLIGWRRRRGNHWRALANEAATKRVEGDAMTPGIRRLMPGVTVLVSWCDPNKLGVSLNDESDTL